MSSAEAEFHGVAKVSGIGLGFQSLLSDLGVQVPVRVWTDSSTAMGVCQRQGLGKLRHMETHTLWVQHAVRSRRIELRKILGEENPAELFTKSSFTADKLRELVHLQGCTYETGRPEHR